jgi:large subunit ribosomal protein L3
MSKKSPRKGSLQFWPRKRANKFLPSVNWNAIKSDSSKHLKGFLCYKAGMASAYVKNNTEHSMTKGKNIIVPVTILECPPMKIFSVRFYKEGKVAKEILLDNLEKELKRKIKIPKKKSGKIAEAKIDDFEDIRVIAYSQVKKAGLKKTPDLIEIGLKGSLEEKLDFVKNNSNKEISILDVFEDGKLVDIRGLTKGKGLQGPVKRFGITLKAHKSEKGVRRPGSLGPWHPARVTFRAPLAGQIGMFTRVVYNNQIIKMIKGSEKPAKNIKNYGDIRGDFILVVGSVPGTAKRQLIITSSLRKTKKQEKKKYSFIELR